MAIISYPDDGTPQHNAVSGKWRIDFWKGEVISPSGTVTTLKTKLSRSGSEYIRSVIIYSSNTVKVEPGVSGSQAKTWTPPNSWTILENVKIRELVFELTESVTPDEHALLVVANTEPQRAYDPKTTVNFHTSDHDAAATSDSYATIFEKYVPAYKFNTFIVRETGSTNGLTYKVEAKMHSSEGYAEVQGDTTVAAGADDVVIVEGHYGWLRLQAKNTTGGQNAQLTAEWGGSG